MARVRLSTTVDEELLAEARRIREGTDAALVDDALRALLARHRGARIDALYDAGYTLHPLAEPDEWGDLASFRDAVASS